MNYSSTLERLSEGPLCRMLRAEASLPTSPHYDSLARPSLAQWLGQVSEQLVLDAVAERASGQHTLH
jgi:hypothetical protein